MRAKNDPLKRIYAKRCLTLSENGIYLVWQSGDLFIFNLRTR